MNASVLIILIVTGICCLVPGIFLSLKNLSMITDAISHSILLGIVLGFSLSGSIDSPLVMIGAMIVGIITSLLINWLSKNKKVNNDGATAIVFPLFFAFAIILISLFFDNVHLDVDSVLLGEVIYAPLDTIRIVGIDVPQSLIATSIVLILNVIFATTCYRGLKLSCFDETQAKINNFKPWLINIGLMIMVSLTAVVSFQSIGSILVIALMIGPVVCAQLFAKDLRQLIYLSICFALLYVTLGYLLAVWFDVSVAGMIATVIGIGFMLCCLFKPQSGLLTKLLLNHQIKKTQLQMIVLDLLTTPTSIDDVVTKTNLQKQQVNHIINHLLTNKLIMHDTDKYMITTLGRNRLERKSAM